ncbi:MAG: hypothetical protein ACRD0G_04335 [Acidimicrobiales bacterium]
MYLGRIVERGAAADGVSVRCATESPVLTDATGAGRLAACHYAQRVALTATGSPA